MTTFRRRWTSVTLGLLIVLMLSWDGCATKLEPSQTASRAYVQAYIEPETVDAIRALYPNADIQVGDVIVTKEGFQTGGRSTLLDIFHFTK